jgi:hypothetical protein
VVLTPPTLVDWTSTVGDVAVTVIFSWKVDGWVLKLTVRIWPVWTGKYKERGPPSVTA